MQTKPSIVFVHGIWADGSSFSKVIPTLRAEGHEVIAAQYGLDTLAGDVAAVKRTLGRVSSPAILVGHSYGGTVITAGGTDDRVAGLVYVAASPRMPARRRRASRISLPPQTFSPTSKSQKGGYGCSRKVSHASRETCPTRSRSSSGRLSSRRPRTCCVAKRMGAAVCEVESSHVPMLSNPGFVIDVIRAAAQTVQGSRVKASR